MFLSDFWFLVANIIPETDFCGGDEDSHLRMSKVLFSWKKSLGLLPEGHHPIAKTCKNKMQAKLNQVNHQNRMTTKK